MVKANAALTGNCLRFKSKGNPESEGVNVILGKKTQFPAFLPVIISASITRSPKFNTRSLVPLVVGWCDGPG